MLLVSEQQGKLCDVKREPETRVEKEKRRRPRSETWGTPVKVKGVEVLIDDLEINR